MAGNEARKNKGSCHRRSEAREGYGMIMPKNIAELEQGRTDLQVAAHRLVMKLSLENAVRTSLWHFSRVVVPCHTNVGK